MQFLLQPHLTHFHHQAADIQKQSAESWRTFQSLKCRQKCCAVGGLAKPTKESNPGTLADDIAQVLYLSSCTVTMWRSAGLFMPFVQLIMLYLSSCCHCRCAAFCRPVHGFCAGHGAVLFTLLSLKYRFFCRPDHGVCALHGAVLFKLLSLSLKTLLHFMLQLACMSAVQMHHMSPMVAHESWSYLALPNPPDVC